MYIGCCMLSSVGIIHHENRESPDVTLCLTGVYVFAMSGVEQFLSNPKSTTKRVLLPPAMIIVYQNLIAFLQKACDRTPSRNEVAKLRRVLKGYSTSSESISAIIGSLECKKILLEISSQLGLADDPNLRSALRIDEEAIAQHLALILDSKSQKDAVLRLEGDSAQSFLDIVQDTLNRGFLMDPEHSRRARHLIRRLSESCDKLPSSLFIIGVSGREEQPTFGGGFGDIFRARYNNQTVALKHMRHFLRGEDLRRIRLKFCREALVWKDLDHQHILTFIGIDRDSFPSSLCMVSPWMEHGTVLNYLKDHGHGNVDKLLFQIAQGLQYLHSHNIVHGDLRGANILIDEHWSARLADFGLSVFENATTAMQTSNRAGSIYWMAPELIDPERFGCRYMRTKASDVYAFGCVCLEARLIFFRFVDVSSRCSCTQADHHFRICHKRRLCFESSMVNDQNGHLELPWYRLPSGRI
ncbi:kinase-like domain-containing protein [Mycena maculata]|uniref:Kinase-like domain-containing protein n=1 Tax=Mycena maculata TaxID=230809 RepID=A0AAD7HZF9_9AGAR|nr:kinase-like domain-containing protein [Mycena maculata]